VSSEPFDPRFGAGFRELIGTAHAHLRNALEYTLLIPSTETGIRRFCLWAIGLAVLTLRKIEHNPRFTAGAQVKITRSAVAMTRLLTKVAGRSDWLLRRLFAQAARGLPLARLSDLRRPRSAPTIRPEEQACEPERALRRSYGNSGS
jgi:farnesyl-diphosphate farnesyltransferase